MPSTLNKFASYIKCIIIIKNKNITELPLYPETNILKDLELDSLDIMDFIMDVEDRFDVTISNKELTLVHTISDLALVVKDKMV